MEEVRYSKVPRGRQVVIAKIKTTFFAGGFNENTLDIII
jgi:hypothetical protein